MWPHGHISTVVVEKRHLLHFHDFMLILLLVCDPVGHQQLMVITTECLLMNLELLVRKKTKIRKSPGYMAVDAGPLNNVM